MELDPTLAGWIVLLLADLAADEGVRRKNARGALEAIGEPAVPFLIEELRDMEEHVRQDAIRALGAIGDTSAIPALAVELEDERSSCRWLAAEALAGMGVPALEWMLRALEADTGTVQKRRGIRHVLELMKHDRPRLLVPVLDAFHSDIPEIAIRGAASAALHALASLPRSGSRSPRPPAFERPRAGPRPASRGADPFGPGAREALPKRKAGRTATLLNVRELTPAHWDAWRAIRRENPELDSPYFSPEFMQTLGSVREDVFVTVLGSGHDIQGFFPHQRRRFGIGLPAGSRLSDFHGLIAPRDTPCDVPELMRASRLVSWDFHGLLASQAPFAPYHAETVDSHYLDTATGLEGYEAGLRKKGSSQPRKLRVFRRKAEADFAKVEFVTHVADAGMLDTLLEWKSRQYRASDTLDNWSYDWTRDLIHRIHALQSDDFAGMLSALFFDGEIAALHMGIRSRTAWHWWFPRYNAKFARYFPGILLLYLAIEEAPRLGIDRIDLGYGDEEFKLRLRSDAIPVARGRIEMPSAVLGLRRWRKGAEAWVRRTPLLPVVRIPGRVFKRLEKRRRYR